MLRKSLAFIAVLAASLAVVGTALSREQAKPPIVKGTVGPGFTITLKRNGVKVRSLKPMRYRFVIADKSDFHSFVLEREKPGHFEKTLSSVSRVGTKTWTIGLTKGTWKFYCKPHEDTMFGHFRVK